MIELRSVSHAYDGRLALEAVSLEVRRGERLFVLGRNGSGKSTLVKILGALQVPLRGACLISGRDAREIPFRELRRLVGVVFQDPDSQIVGAVVEDDAAFAPENQALPPEEIRARVEEALATVGLLAKRRSPVSSLSGGEKQRLAIAGALAARVPCLILDEPTSMLDPEGCREVNAALRALRGRGTTLVQATHQLEGLDDEDQVLVMERGHLAWRGRAAEFWPLAEGMGFDLPQSPLSSLRSAPPAARESFIEVKDLSFHFEEPHSVTALSGVMARVPKGGWLSIVGRTGSGKSTLAQHLNGLYKIQSGTLRIEGEPLPQKGEALYALRRRVGLVFQSPEDQFFCPTVEEELSFAPTNGGLSGEALRAAVLGALDRVGLGRDFLPRSPLALSGGERRLVAIASVLAAEPECLVLDEPTAGLDADYRRRLLTLLSQLRDEGRSVVVITHDLNAALQYSDQVLVLDGGRTVAQGTPRSVIPALKGVFLA